MKHILLFGMLTLQSLSALAREVPYDASFQLTDAEALLEKDIMTAPGGVVALTKPLRLYTYFNAAMQGSNLWPTYQTVEARSNLDRGQTVADLSYGAGAFWDLNNHTTKLVNGGPGMYLAIDPQVSKKYGTSNYAVTFPVGTKYIDVSDPTWKHVSKIKLAKETLKALIAENIIQKTDISALAMHNGYFTRVSMQNIAAVGNERFRNAVSRIFSKNKIVMVQYTWESTKLKLFCKRASPSAFVFVGERPSESVTSNVRAYVSDAIVQGAVFMSQFTVDQYTDAERQVVETTSRMRMALDTNSKNALTVSEQAEVKQLTYGCE